MHVHEVFRVYICIKDTHMYRDRYRLSNSAHACESILQPPHSSSKPLGVGIAISLRPAILHHVVNIVIDPAEADMLAEAVAVFWGVLNFWRYLSLFSNFSLCFIYWGRAPHKSGAQQCPYQICIIPMICSVVPPKSTKGIPICQLPWILIYQTSFTVQVKSDRYWLIFIFNYQPYFFILPSFTKPSNFWSKQYPIAIIPSCCCCCGGGSQQ